MNKLVATVELVKFALPLDRMLRKTKNHIQDREKAAWKDEGPHLRSCSFESFSPISLVCKNDSGECKGSFLNSFHYLNDKDSFLVLRCIGYILVFY